MTTPVALDRSSVPALERIVAALRRPAAAAEAWRVVFDDMSRILLQVAAAPAAVLPVAETTADWSAFRTGDSVSVLGADVVLSGSVRGGEVTAARVSVRDGGTASFSVDLVSGTVTMLAGLGQEAASLTWSPDGRIERGPTVEAALAGARMAPEVVAEGLAQLDRLPGGTAPESPASADAPGEPTPSPGSVAAGSGPSHVAAHAPVQRPADVEVCGRCGEIMHAGERYCPRCGAEVTPAAARACAHCGASMPADVRFCPSCGAARPDRVPPPAPTTILATPLPASQGATPVAPAPRPSGPPSGPRAAGPPSGWPPAGPIPDSPGAAPSRPSPGPWTRRLRWVVPVLTTALITGVGVYAATRSSTPGPGGSTTVPTTVSPSVTTPPTTASPSVTTPPTTSPRTTGTPSLITTPAVSPYLGLRYSTLPAGVSQLGDGAPLGGYRVRWVRDASASMFWLERILEEESLSSPGSYEVVDVVVVPAQQEGTADVFLVGGVPCEVDGASTDAVAGVFVYQQPPAYYDQVSAWRIDTAAGRLVPLGPGVRCRDQVTGG